MKKICYVTGTRAEFGLFQSTLEKINASKDIKLSILVTGMHVLPEIGKIGQTLDEIKASGFSIAGIVRTPSLALRSGEGMVLSISEQLPGMVELFKENKFDAIIVLGDRGEMLAATIAAAHLEIPVIHVHGGERSGTIDESIRHAISKLSHYHFVATEESRDRLVKMGESIQSIFVVGAPGLDAIVDEKKFDTKKTLCAELGFNPDEKIALSIFHPVLQKNYEASEQVENLIHALEDSDLQTMFLHPNADAGSGEIVSVLKRVSSPKIKIIEHLPRSKYLSWLSACDVIVGNSSSGIIEAASLSTPVVDVGSRQQAREASENVIRVGNKKEEIQHGINQAFKLGKKQFTNVYGDGKSGLRIVEILNKINFDKSILNKLNTY